MYVPLVFDPKWIPAIPVLILICLSAIPRPFAKAASQGLWLIDKPQWDVAWNLAFTVIFVVALLIGVQWQIFGVATAVLLTHVVILPIFTVAASRHVLMAATRRTDERFAMAGLYVILGQSIYGRIQGAAERLTFFPEESVEIIAEQKLAIAWVSHDPPMLFGPAYHSSTGVRVVTAGRVAWDEPDWRQAESLHKYTGGLSTRSLQIST